MTHPDADYDAAVAHVRRTNEASCAYMQRTLKMPYNAAARHIDRMQKEGIVSKPNRFGQRKVLPQGGAA
jgi:S-DNA-T family DNA segregation ATPase FtsK/SpoIIIE